MILQGARKKTLTDAVQYYVDTTGCKYTDFIDGLLAFQCGQLDTTQYPNWLLNEMIQVLKERDITLNDCLENKDVIRSVENEHKVVAEGEFYTPEGWCVAGREYIKRMLGEQWGSINVLDMCAGTGNLMKTAGYPDDKLFLSTLLPEDVSVLQSIYPNATVFQCDFLKDIDYDENNKNFSNKLPENLRHLFETDAPILFFMNPPYKQCKAEGTDVGAYMTVNNMKKASTNLLYQCLYRVLMLKRFYNLTHLYLAFYGSPAWLFSDVLNPIYTEVRKEFDFHSGMYFPNINFTNTSSTILWSITFTMWQPKGLTPEPPHIWLDAMTLDNNGKAVAVGGRNFERPEITLSEWVKAKDIVAQTQDLCFTTWGVTNNTLGKRALNALAQIMTDDNAVTMRSNCIINGTTIDRMDITEENFERAVASYSTRMCFKRIVNPYNSSQWYSKPNTEAEGYHEWYCNALILFTFDWGNRVQSYRNFKGAGELWTYHNPFFPFTAEYIRQITTDPVILKDLDENPFDNSFFLKKLTEAIPYLTPTGRAFYDLCMQYLAGSYAGDTRQKMKYSNYTDAWDTSLMQVRRAEGYWTAAMEEEYFKRARALKDELQVGIYKFGFLQRYSNSCEDLGRYTFSESELERMSVEVEKEAEPNGSEV